MAATAQAFATYLDRTRPLVGAYLRDHQPQAAPALTKDSTVLRVQGDLARYLYSPLERFTASGGKRIRPVLTLLGCEAAGGDPAAALSCACAIEDFQSAALIHDDIADEGELRRGEPCVHVREGVGVAINVGDLALVTVFAKVLRDPALTPALRERALGELLLMEERTLEGQALDLGWARDGRWDLTVDDYLCMASHKTAYYSAATPLALGAICAGAPEDTVEGLRAFGMDAGLAFQLQDDLLNLVGDAQAQGKDFRTDITEGKRTMAVCWALEHLEPALRTQLVGILSAGTHDPADLARAVSLMEASGAIEAVHQKALDLVDSATSHLDGVELVEGFGQTLESMAHFFVERVA